MGGDNDVILSVKPCPHCHRFRRLSQKSATVAVFGDSRRFWRQIVAEIGDYSRQCGQAFRLTQHRSCLSRNPKSISIANALILSEYNMQVLVAILVVLFLNIVLIHDSFCTASGLFSSYLIEFTVYCLVCGFLLFARYVPNVAKEEYMRSV